MRSRWSDADARDLSPLELLVYVSRLMGQDTSLVVWLAVAGGLYAIVATVYRREPHAP